MKTLIALVALFTFAVEAKSQWVLCGISGYGEPYETWEYMDTTSFRWSEEYKDSVEFKVVDVPKGVKAEEISLQNVTFLRWEIHTCNLSYYPYAVRWKERQKANKNTK